MMIEEAVRSIDLGKSFGELFTFLLFPEFPEQLKFLPFVVLGILGLAAVVDAWSGKIPNSLIIIGLSAVIFLTAAQEDWGVGFGRILMAVIAFLALKAINEGYLNLCNKDAFGMGDAKWTALAAAAFGLSTAFWGWAIGAWLGLLWLGFRHVLGFVWHAAKPEGYIHFAPFLLIGIVVKTYVIPLFFITP